MFPCQHSRLSGPKWGQQSVERRYHKGCCAHWPHRQHTMRSRALCAALHVLDTDIRRDHVRCNHAQTRQIEGGNVLEDVVRQLTQKHTCCHSLARTQHICQTPPRHTAVRMPGVRNAYCQTPRGCFQPVSIACVLQQAARQGTAAAGTVRASTSTSITG
jgi:hypothetical protein